MDKLFETLQAMTDEAEQVKYELEKLRGLHVYLKDDETGKIRTTHDPVYRKRFEKNQQEGVAAYNVEWLSAQERAIEVATFYNFNIELPQVKAFLTDLVFQTLKKK